MEEVIIDLPQPQKNIYSLIEEKIGVSFSELSYQELITEESFRIKRKDFVLFGGSNHEEVFWLIQNMILKKLSQEKNIQILIYLLIYTTIIL